MGRLSRGSLAAAVGVLLAGCGGSHHGDTLPGLGSAVTVAPPAAPGLTDSTALRSKLLTTADLPPGFTQLEDGPASNDAPAQPDRSHTEPAACARVLAPVADQLPGASAHAAAHYVTADFASVDIDIASYPNGGAAQAFSVVQSLLRDCGSYDGTDADGTAVHYRLGGLEQPATGDASASFQVRTTSQGMTLYSVATVAVIGSSVVQLADTAPKPVDPAALHDLVAKQASRLQGLAGP
ncbi:sensor domain-containing protein [Nocardia sp. BMG111209]|uniref:sensor domain-containing protein n=1 Tax=Nocardia sp. BMG111209 TaxID=1160137 RepID=UPI0003786E3B|nr:sensor domain-containing protein [Nocardia sp. BMG111209]